MLTEEISLWLQNELNDCDDPVLKKAFGDQNYRSNDFFHQPDSLRLRAAGYQLLRHFFDYEEFVHEREFYTGEIITLSRHMNAPFYINREKIVLFHQEHIVMCKLAGSVGAWLSNFPDS